MGGVDDSGEKHPILDAPPTLPPGQALPLSSAVRGRGEVRDESAPRHGRVPYRVRGAVTSFFVAPPPQLVAGSGVNSQEALETGYRKPLQTESCCFISVKSAACTDSRLNAAGRSNGAKVGASIARLCERVSGMAGPGDTGFLGEEGCEECVNEPCKDEGSGAAGWIEIRQKCAPGIAGFTGPSGQALRPPSRIGLSSSGVLVQEANDSVDDCSCRLRTLHRPIFGCGGSDAAAQSRDGAMSVLTCDRIKFRRTGKLEIRFFGQVPNRASLSRT